MALRRFVSDAAHELNTLLTALRTSLDLAVAGGETGVYLARAQAQVDRLEALAASLLDLSRLEAEGERAVPEPLDLAAMAREVSEPYASMAEQRGLALSLELPGVPVIVQGDPAQLARALGNLLDNAVSSRPLAAR